MPLFGLGTWRSDKNLVAEAVRTALSIGYRQIDCAAIYGNEKEIGEAIKCKIYLFSSFLLSLISLVLKKKKLLE